MNPISLKTRNWGLTVGFIIIGLMMTVSQFWRPGLAQNEICFRPELAPAPAPIIGQQPTLSDVAQVLTAQADKYNWPNWLLKTIAKVESNWRQVDHSQNNTSNCAANEGDTACTCVSKSKDYGVMQLNWSVHHNYLDWDACRVTTPITLSKGPIYWLPVSSQSTLTQVIQVVMVNL